MKKNYNVRVICSIVLVTCSFSAQGQTSAWSLQGRVSGQGGEALAGVRVMVGYVAGEPSQELPPIPVLSGIPLAAGLGKKPAASPTVLLSVVGITDTNNAGEFTVEGTKPGEVVVCVVGAKMGYLDPCHWDEKPTTFAVAPGKNVKGGKVTVRKGARVRVRLEDSQGRLLNKSGKPVTPLLWTYSTSLGMVYPMVLESATADVITHAALVESQKTVKLKLTQDGLTIQEPQGKPNKKSVDLDVVMPAAGGEQVVTLKVLAIDRQP